MKVAIVGGGITGLFCAHYLVKSGHSVSIIERSKTGSVTSIYNAGLLTPSLAPNPGIALEKIVSTFLGKESSVYVSPRKIFENGKWFRIALKKGKRGYRDRLVQMGRMSLKLYEQFFADEGFRPDLIKGVVALYSKETDAKRAQACHGGDFLDEKSIVQMGFRGFQGGIMLKEEWSVNPVKLYSSLWDAVIRRERADLIVGNEVKLLAERGNTHALLQVDANRVGCDAIVVAAGSWTRALCKQLGYEPLIIPARGLAIVFDTGGREIVTTPALLEDYGIGLAQHNESTLRITGFFEIVGLRTDFSQARKKWLLDRFQKHVVKSDQVRIVEEGVGFRPCTPDQMPVIGSIPGYRNAYVASGNCRLGITLAPATAHILTSMIIDPTKHGETFTSDQTLWYDPARFSQ